MHFFKYLTSFFDKPEPVLQFYFDTEFTRNSDGRVIGNERSTYMLRENAFGFRDVKIFQGTLSETKEIAKRYTAGFFMWQTSTQKPCDIPWGEFFRGCSMQVLHKQRYGQTQALAPNVAISTSEEKEDAVGTYKF